MGPHHGSDPRRQIELTPDQIKDPQAIQDALNERELQLIVEDDQSDD